MDINQEVSTFESITSTIPVFNTTEHGKGFLPPFFKAAGHLLYLAGRQAESATRKPNDVDIQDELESCLKHLDNVNVEGVTPRVAEAVFTIRAMVEHTQKEYRLWEAKERDKNFIKMAHIASLVMPVLDRELLGYRDSDAGILL